VAIIKGVTFLLFYQSIIQLYFIKISINYYLFSFAAICNGVFLLFVKIFTFALCESKNSSLDLSFLIIA